MFYILFLLTQSYPPVLSHIYRECVHSLESLTGRNGHILVRDNIFHLCAGFHNRILHEDAVFDFGALANPDTAEQDAVFNLPLNDASIGGHDIGGLGTVDVTGRVVITDFGVDGVPA